MQDFYTCSGLYSFCGRTTFTQEKDLNTSSTSGFIPGAFRPGPTGFVLPCGASGSSRCSQVLFVLYREPSQELPVSAQRPSRWLFLRQLYSGMDPQRASERTPQEEFHPLRLCSEERPWKDICTAGRLWFGFT